MTDNGQICGFCCKEIEHIHWYGRTGAAQDGAVALFWTASGFAVETGAGALWAELEASWSQYEPWVGVWVDGVQVSRFMPEEGRHWYCLFRGLPAGTPHRIALLKETQAMSGDPQHRLLVHALGVPRAAADKPFLPLQARSRRIEFVGDSITTGEGLAGAVDEMDWISGWMALRDNYALRTAKAFGADFHILSQSGWGVVTSWDNDRNCVLPKHYGCICSLAGGQENAQLGAQERWDFSRWQPDAVVVNLGTNDCGAFRNPPHTDPQSGAVWKMRVSDDGGQNEEDIAFLQQGIKDFLAAIRSRNPRAHIVWAYGMCGFELGERIRAAVEDYARASGDTAVTFLALPSMSDETEEEKGSRQHPGPGTHRRASALLVQELKRALGW